MASGMTVPIASIGTTNHFILPPTANRGTTQNFALPPTTIMSGNGNPPPPISFITRAFAPRLGQPAMVRDFGHAHLAHAKNKIAVSLARGSVVITRFLPEMKMDVAKMGDMLDDAIKAEEDQVRHPEHLQAFFDWDDELTRSESTASTPDTQMGGQTLPNDDNIDNDHAAAAILEKSHALRQKVEIHYKNVECCFHLGQIWRGDECPEAEVFGPGGKAPGPRVPHPSTFLDELREEKKQWEILWQGCWVAWERVLDLHGRMTTLAKVWKVSGNQPGTAERR